MGITQALSEALWAPIGQALPNQTNRIIISPDGEVNFISFATLLTKDKQFLAQAYTVQYVASGRDLLRELMPSTAKEVVLFANPDFDLASTPMLAKAEDRSSEGGSKSMRGSEKREIEDWSFENLTGTQKESDELSKSLPDGVGRLVTLPPKRRQKKRSLGSIRPIFCIWPRTGFSLKRIRLRPKRNPQRF